MRMLGRTPQIAMVVCVALVAGCSGNGVKSIPTPADQGVADDGAASDGGTAARMLSLVAGRLGGGGNVDGTGAAARFGFDLNVVADGAGNLYVADSQSFTIRKVVIATGVVTTVAGAADMSGSTDGTGAAARFNTPSGIATDGAGNLYIADTGNNSIRKLVIATGVVTTLAGTAGSVGSTDGTGAAARFLAPEGMAADAGNLYIADGLTIRKLVIATGVVTTFAGSATTAGSADGTGVAAQFENPSAVAADGAGNLYIADTGNNTVRKVVIGTAVVTTLAGTAGMSGSTDATGPAARFDHPSGLATDGAGSLYLADSNNDTLRKVVIATGVVTTVVGTAGGPGSADGTGTMAKLSYPAGVAADGAGNLYVADGGNASIRKMVIATGVVTTLAGTAVSVGSTDGTGLAARFHSPYGVASDGAGNLYIADSLNQTIRKVVVATGVVTTLAGAAGMAGSTDGTGTAARFSQPAGIAADGAGNLYLADHDNSTLRKVVIATGVVTTLAGSAGTTGSTDGTGAAAQFRYPCCTVTDAAGNLYVADAGNHTIRKLVIATGVVTTLTGTAGMSGSTDGTGAAARFNSLSALATDGAGNLYIADSNDNTIRKLVIATGVVTTLAGTAGVMSGSTDGTGAAARFNSPYGMAADGAGDLYVADTNSSTIRKIVIATGVVTTEVGVAGRTSIVLGALPAELNRPESLALLPGGELIIVDYGENAVLEVK